MISLLVWLCIVGVIVYLINTIVPLPGWMRTVINCVAAIFVLLFILNAFGLYSSGLRLRN